MGKLVYSVTMSLDGFIAERISLTHTVGVTNLWFRVVR